ncbi:MAG: hypothetical protein QM784_02145 [Polyangiaceae bacterium]
MPTSRTLLLFTLLLLPSCAGDAFTSSGGEGGSGGTQNGNGGTTSCSKLAETYLRALLQARTCNPDDENSCNDSKTLLDRCGCEVPVNTNSDAINTAEKAFSAYEDDNCPTVRPATCSESCPEITSEFVASCQEASGGAFVCDWAK